MATDISPSGFASTTVITYVVTATTAAATAIVRILAWPYRVIAAQFDLDEHVRDLRNRLAVAFLRRSSWLPRAVDVIVPRKRAGLDEPTASERKLLRWRTHCLSVAA